MQRHQGGLSASFLVKNVRMKKQRITLSHLGDTVEKANLQREEKDSSCQGVEAGRTEQTAQSIFLPVKLFHWQPSSWIHIKMWLQTSEHIKPWVKLQMQDQDREARRGQEAKGNFYLLYNLSFPFYLAAMAPTWEQLEKK